MQTKKVNLTITKYYSEQVQIELDVDINIKDDDLVNYLTNDEDGNIDAKIVEAFDKSNLVIDETKYEYYDNDTQIGGHL
jgi:hypothetical protein